MPYFNPIFIWNGPMNSPIAHPEVLTGAANAVGISVKGVEGMIICDTNFTPVDLLQPGKAYQFVPSAGLKKPENVEEYLERKG